MAGRLVTPDELRRIAEEREMQQMREALDKKRKMDQEHDHLREAFMSREVHLDVFDRLSRVVKGAAERGEREVLALRFASEYCTDGGRAINSFEPNWPETVTGFAQRAYEFWQRDLEPQGYNSLLERAGFTLADIPQEWEAFWSFWCDRVQPALRNAIGREDIWAVGLPMSVAATVDTDFELTQFQLAYQASWLSRDRRVQVDDPAVRARMVRAMGAYTEIWRKGCTPPDR